MICNECETVAHCEKHGCIPKQPAQQDMPINEGWHITVVNGHSGYGVYAHMEDYPEEGAVLVQAIDQPAQRKPLTDAVHNAFLQGIRYAANKYEVVSDERFTGGDVSNFLLMEAEELDSSDITRAIEAKLKEKNT